MVNAEVYKQFIKDIELEDICIVDATFQRKWQDLQLPESTSVQVNFEPKWQLNKQFLLIRTLFKVTASSEEINDTAPKKPIDIFEISFTMQLVYSHSGQELEQISEEKRRELLSTFIQRNVPVNAWPYAREFISSTTVRMGFPALVIGTFKVNI